MKRSLIISLWLMLLPCLAFGHGTGGHASAKGRFSATDAPRETTMGLQERLGAAVPLGVMLRDETGTQVRLGDLVTGPTLIVPGYYGCTNVCNSLFWGLTTILPQIKGVPGDDYRVIAVSIDETETPEVAARYKRMYLSAMKGPFPAYGWRFLTGERKDVQQLMDAAGYAYRRQGREVAHPVASFVVTGEGVIVRYLYGSSLLPKDVALALAEAREGRVGATIRTAVRYCFSFDPATKSYEFNLLRVSATVVIAVCGMFLAYLILGGERKRS